MQQTTQKKTEPREIELLAPARDLDTAIAAIDHGADAVYMGASILGARKAAGNTVDDIRQTSEYAHLFGARVYVTVNTIIYEHELTAARNLVWDLYRAGVDALIVQDMALLRMDLPPIALHASTQCDTRDASKAAMLEEAGFSQIVLARELSLDEIAAIHNRVKAPLEVFVHGALCVSYSGDCQASWAITGRSANRGECAQVCRMAFDLEDGKGNKLIKGKHLMSLRDLNRIADLSALLDAGASSLKIEGRLKDIPYVKNVVSAYRKALDNIIEANPDRYRRASAGTSRITFTPDLAKSFNRTYTPYFLKGRPASLANFDTPKWTGEYVGKVSRTERNGIMAYLDEPVNNGDGLVFRNREGAFEGFRVNRAEGNRLFPAQPVNIAPGTALYRNSDTARLKMLAGKTAERTLAISLTLRPTPSGIALDACDETGISVSCAVAVELLKAQTDQRAARARTLAKTGGTIFSVTEIHDNAGDMFIPASILTGLRRDTLEMLVTARQLRHTRPLPGKTKAELATPATLSRHDNVANSLATEFYAAHGTQTIEPAIEVSARADKEIRVMECRYCLRHELGACTKTPEGRKLPRELYLVTANNRFRLEFDCRACLMRLWYQPRG